MTTNTYRLAVALQAKAIESIDLHAGGVYTVAHTFGEDITVVARYATGADQRVLQMWARDADAHLLGSAEASIPVGGGLNASHVTAFRCDHLRWERRIIPTADQYRNPVPTTSTRGATANPSRSSASSTPTKIPPSTTTADRCFASNSPMAKPFSRGPRRSTATSPSRAAGVHNPRPRRDVVCTPAAAPVVVGPPHRQTPPPPPAYTLPPHRAGAWLTTALVRARSAAPLPPIGVPPVAPAARSAAALARCCASPAIPRRTAGRPPAARARPIISMLSRWVPPITCSRPVSPGRLTRTQIGLSHPCSARTDGSNATPPRAAASA